jgi:hypothetical protein
MEDDMDNRRTESARDNDDSELIDRAEPAPNQGGTSGGNLQEDVATQAELERVRDPEAMEGVDKQDDIDHQQRFENARPADKVSGGNPSE